MYKVVCTDSNANNHNLYIGSVESLKITDAKVELELGKSGSFDFTIYSTHPCYSAIEKMKAIITVFDDDTIIFRGRVLNDEIGINLEKHITCEGDLSFLLDSIIAPHTYNGSFSGYLSYVISAHNAKVQSSKQFTIGSVTVGDFSGFKVEEVEYKTAWDLLNSYMVARQGGYLIVRYDGYTRYVDLLNEAMDVTNVSTQKVEFGKNMLDIKIATQNQDVFSCLIPLGAKAEGSEARLNIKSVNNNVDYISNATAIQKYGYIYKTVVFDDITVASTLKSTATTYLNSHYDAEISTEISAIDLSAIDSSVDAFKLGQYVNVYSRYHFASNPQNLLIKKLTVNILNPADNQIEIGSVRKGITDMTGGSSSTTVINQEAEQPYLIESGTTNIWKWAKYSDGTAECFGKVNVSDEQTGTALGNWYRSNQVIGTSEYAYPVAFTEAPVVNMQFHTYNSNGGLLWTFQQNTTQAREYVPGCYIIKPTTSTGIYGNISILVRGKCNVS